MFRICSKGGNWFWEEKEPENVPLFLDFHFDAYNGGSSWGRGGAGDWDFWFHLFISYFNSKVTWCFPVKLCSNTFKSRPGDIIFDPVCVLEIYKLLSSHTFGQCIDYDTAWGVGRGLFNVLPISLETFSNINQFKQTCTHEEKNLGLRCAKLRLNLAILLDLT